MTHSFCVCVLAKMSYRGRTAHKKTLRCGTVVTLWSMSQINFYIDACRAKYFTLANQQYGPLTQQKMADYTHFRQICHRLIHNFGHFCCCVTRNCTYVHDYPSLVNFQNSDSEDVEEEQSLEISDMSDFECETEDIYCVT